MNPENIQTQYKLFGTVCSYVLSERDAILDKLIPSNFSFK
jgi:hypothetical protein